MNGRCITQINLSKRIAVHKIGKNYDYITIDKTNSDFLMGPLNYLIPEYVRDKTGLVGPF